MLSISEERKLFREARAIARRFRHHPGVTDIELGLKHTGGKLTGQWALRFRVEVKKPESRLTRHEILPDKTGRLVTDVLPAVTDRQQALSEDPQGMVRPLLGGLRIQSGLYQDTSNSWGTLGCFYPLNGQLLGWSSYHVLFGGAGESSVFQHYAGKLAVYLNLNRPGNLIGTAAGLFSRELDYATIDPSVLVDPDQSLNPVSGLISACGYPRIGMAVIKAGAASGLTYGIIDGRSCLHPADLSICPDPAYEPSPGPLSAYGDSGSCWVQVLPGGSLKLIALHFGGNEQPPLAKARAFVSILASGRALTVSQSDSLIVFNKPQ